jgi:hypothetical protein
MPKYLVDAENGIVSLGYGDGPEQTIHAEVKSLPEDIRIRLAAHGLKRCLVDSHATPPPAGVDVTEYRISQASAKLEALQAGRWSVRGEGVPRTSMYAEALAEVTGEPIEAAIEVWAGLDDKTKKKVRKQPAFAKVYARLQAERAKAKADALPEAEGDTLELEGLFS